MKHYVNPKFIPDNYQQCTKTVMDNISDPNIVFDSEGVCNYYYQYFEEEKKHVLKGEKGKQKFDEIIKKIKAEGKNRKYDCILGVSGGVDSTYLAYIAKQENLRVLCVHFDNGWNSELAVKNIEKIINYTGFDLETFVINWEEFKDIQRAYFKANVVDIEAITDHAISGTLYKLAAKNNIKYILSGNNVVTESLLPKYWIFNKIDHVNIIDIHKKHGTIPLRTFPFFGLKAKHYYNKFKGIKTVDLLNLITYNKVNVKKQIVEKLSWKDYGGKHFESIFTRFYQGYILPQKFGIDKRKAHLSNLICSGQITRNDALQELQTTIYDAFLCGEDMQFVLKKLGFTNDEFVDYIKQNRREHSYYKTEMSLFETYPILKPLRPLSNMIRNIT